MTAVLVLQLVAIPPVAVQASGGSSTTWGSDASGQLSLATSNQGTPQLVTSLSNITAVAAGDQHSLAVRTDGTVWAWGADGHGQLGYAGSDSLTPVQVAGVSGASAASGGWAYSMVLAGGHVWAWGRNVDGELGNGTNTDSSAPVEVCAPGQTAPCGSFLSNIIAISAGWQEALALRNDGTVWAWGGGWYGQLGNGTASSSTVPVEVCAVGQTAPCGSFLSGVTSIAMGAHSAIALAAGTLVGWGWNLHGEVGDGTTNTRTVPVVVSGGLANVVSVGKWNGSSAAVVGPLPGTVWAWGQGGQIGDGTFTDSLVPLHVCAVGQTAPCASFLAGVSTVLSSAGAASGGVVESDGTARTWGDDRGGQLGDAASAYRTTPVEVCATGQSAPCVSFFGNVTTIAMGNYHTVALTSAGAVYTWGANESGELGLGTMSARSSATSVGGLVGITQLSGGDGFSMALSGGNVYMWGDNHAGQLGNGTSSGSVAPVEVCAPGQTAPCASFLSNVSAIAAGGDFAMALTTGGNVYTWGANWDGALGTGSTTWSNVPVEVCAVGGAAPCGTFLGGVTAISASGDHALAVIGGNVYAWGRDVEGEDGNGVFNPGVCRCETAPVEVEGVGGVGFLSSIGSVAAGGTHSLALSTTGVVYGWGADWANQLGDNTLMATALPVHTLAVGGAGNLTSINAIAAGLTWSMALTSAGGVDAWGDNNYGELGDGNTSGASFPVQVQGVGGVGTLSGITAIVAGGNHGLALTGGATVVSWGDNESGQLGDVTTTTSDVPVNVASLTAVTGIGAGDFHSLAIGSAGCGGGSLTVTPPPSVAFPGVTIAAAGSTSTTTGNITVGDLRGTGAGWQVDATSTTFTAGGHALPTTATTVTGASSSNGAPTCASPVNFVGYPVTLPAGSTPPAPAQLYNATANSGEGNQTVTLNFSVAIPGYAYSGSYSSTWTFTVASGP